MNQYLIYIIVISIGYLSLGILWGAQIISWPVWIIGLFVLGYALGRCLGPLWYQQWS